MRYLKITALFIFCSVLITFSAMNGKAAPENEEITILKQKISDLENRIKDLEGMLKIYRETLGKVDDKDSGWWNSKSWRKLKEGMSQEEVKRILGEPIKAIKGQKEIWYYPNFYQSVVSFDEKGKLKRWIAP